MASLVGAQRKRALIGVWVRLGLLAAGLVLLGAPQAASAAGLSAYVTNAGSGTVSQYTVGAGGALGAKSPATVTAGSGPVGVAVSPDGASVYVTNQGSGTVSQYTVGAGGALSAKSPATVPAGSGPFGVAVSPDGASVYVTNFNSDTVSQYTVGAGGALGAKSPATVPAGSLPFGVALQPDQGPVAVFSAVAGAVGSPTSFDGSPSSDSDGTVARYDWDFGDGTSAANAGPMPSHTYAASGSYTATLTVTDDAGCSTARVFTGQTVSCNGTAAARTTRTVTVNKASLGVATQVAPAAITLGSSFKDTATLGPAPTGAPTPTGTVTFNVYGPSDATCSGPALFTSTNPLSAAGTTATSNSFTPASPGTHRVIASYSGDANYNSSTSSCTDPTEAVTVNQAQPPNVPPIIGSAPAGAGGTGGAGGAGGAGGNVFGGGGTGGDGGPCGGGGGGAGGVGATGGGAGGGGCFDVPPVQRLGSGRIVAFVGVATNHSSAQARAFLELRGAGKAQASRLQLIGQTTRNGLRIGRYKLSMPFSTKTRRALRGAHKATVRLRLRLSAPTGKPLTFSRTVILAR